ncbi:hypothetical protein [Serratia fonticola]|uniref:hypothetical protein n=1 Tax=Serratia fonticola TaxID=47917 RepID=UPI00301B83DE
MIKLNRMKKIDNLEVFNNNEFDVFFFGKVIDERTEYVLKVIKKPQHRSISFSKDELVMFVNGKEKSLIQFITDDEFKSYSRVIIDSTSLDFPELLYTLYALNQVEKDIEITLIYVEPSSYTRKDSILEEDDEYSLSEGVSNFSALPIFSINNRQNNKNNNILLSFLGFENSMLGQILESDDGATFGKLFAFVAVPAYQAGWENNSLRKHLSYFEQPKTELMLYPGNNPYEVLKRLEKIYNAYANIVIAAIGTKPSTLASALFLVNKIGKNTIEQQIGAIHDYPIKSRGRSSGIGCISAYILSKEKFE